MTAPSGPAYRIHTRRLVLRCWHPQDTARLKTAVDESRQHLQPWMAWAHAESEGVQAHVHRLRSFRAKFDLGQDFAYGIFHREECKVLGGTGLHTRQGEEAREIGYWIHRDHTGQGLATETTAALVKVAFEVDRVSRVEIDCNPDNERSAAVPRKLGFTMEAVLRKRQKFLPGQWRDFMIWTLFADEYPATPAAQAEIEAFDAAGERFV